MNKLTRNIYSTDGGRWLISFLMVATLFFVVGLFCPRVFFINDDENIMYTIAGYYTDGETYDHSFINFCLSIVLRGLYTVLPTVPWYGVFHITVLFVTVSVIFKVLLTESNAHSVPVHLAFGINLMLFFLVYLFPTTLMQFTTTSAMAGAAACMLLLEIRWESDSKKKVNMNMVLSALFLLICYMHRKNTGYVAICFYFGTWLYQLIKVILVKRTISVRRGKYWLRNIIFLACMLILFLVLVIVVSALARSTPQWDAFYDYDTARFKVTDYPHDSYKDNPELYDSLGWSPELYELTGRSWWFFMDPNITPEAFREIAETGYYAERTADSQSLLGPVVSLYNSSSTAKLAFLVMATCGIVFVLLFLFSHSKKTSFWEFMYGSCILMGAITLVFYLSFRQRLPLRAFHTICLPCITIMVLVCLRMLNIPNLSEWRRRFYICVTTFLLFITVVGGDTNLRVSIIDANDRVVKSQRTLAIEEYAMMHPENFYVYDTSLTFRYMPFTVYKDKQPTNLMFWGGMGWKSPAYYRQLELNGLNELYSYALFLDNVYYITWDGYPIQGKPLRIRLLNYMLVTYPHVTFEQVDSLGDDINVYKIGR